MSAFKHFIEGILNPLCLLVIFYAIALVILYQQRIKRWVFYVFFFLWIMLIVLTTGGLPYWLVHNLEKQFPPIQYPDAANRWIVVLSGGQSDSNLLPAPGMLYNASLKRLLEGVRLSHWLPKASLILSGGSYNHQVSEAEHLQRVLSLLKLPFDPKVIVEKRSLNTAQQAKNIKQWVGTEPFYLVTSATHMPRAMKLLQAQHLNPIPAPTDFILYWQDERWEKFYLPNAQNTVYLTLALHEILGMAWHQLGSE